MGLLEPTRSHLTYLAASTFLVLFALASDFVKNRLHASEPPFALLYGIAVGPRGLHIIAPSHWFDADDLREEFTRFVLGVQCLVIGIELPRGYLRRTWRSLTMLLGPVMVSSWVICAVLAKLVLREHEWQTCFAIAACLTPTDPILSASILGDSHFSNRIPKRLRDLLKAESGGNDGVALPLLWLAIYQIRDQEPGRVLKDWTTHTLLYECLVGVAVGLVIGYGSNRLLKLASDGGTIGKASYLAFYLVLATFSIGVGSTLGLDDFVVCFAAGVGFSSVDDFHEPVREAELPTIIDTLFNATFFIYFGSTIPWETLHDHTGRLVGYAALVMLLRRLPPMLLFWRAVPDIRTAREALFCGWFGPMGVGAIHIAQLLRSQVDKDEAVRDAVIPVVYTVVLVSTLVHGFSTGTISIYSHFARDQDRRASVPGAETDLLDGFHD